MHFELLSPFVLQSSPCLNYGPPDADCLTQDGCRPVSQGFDLLGVLLGCIVIYEFADRKRSTEYIVIIMLDALC